MFLVWPPLLYTVMLVAIAMLCKEIGVTVIGVCCVYQWLVTGQWFSPDTPVSSTNKTDCHDITEILL
jgi:hypothetical protein